MSSTRGLRAKFARLYSGDLDVDFVSPRRRRLWYAISGVFLVVSLAALLIRGLNLGIDFTGGSTYELPRGTGSVAQAEEVLRSEGVAEPIVQQLSSGGRETLRVTTPEQTAQQVDATITALARDFGLSEDEVTSSTVGPTWGSEISRKALQGLVLFLIAVVLYLAFRFEPRMAAAAIVALVHDLLITIGIYTLVGFEVTPATVIAVLTILGFSIYDTVIVFDRVRELTRNLSASSRTTYEQAANQALNQTVVRSLNTSLFSALPVASLLFVGAGLLGAGTLKDLALAQFVGILAGTYSSLFIATPMLVQLKQRDPAVVAMNAKVLRAQAAGKVSRRGPARRPASGGVAVLEAEPGGGAEKAMLGSGGEGADEERMAGNRRPSAQVTAGAVASRRVDPARPSRGKGRGKGGRPSGKRRR